MITIILAIVLAIVFTSVALENPSIVPINILGSAFNVPLYVFAAVSFLAGTLLALLYHLFDRTSTTIDLNAKDSQIRDADKVNQNLQAEIQKLTAENSGLREELTEAHSKVRKEKVESAKTNVKNFVGRVREGIA